MEKGGKGGRRCAQGLTWQKIVAEKSQAEVRKEKERGGRLMLVLKKGRREKKPKEEKILTNNNLDKNPKMEKSELSGHNQSN